MSWTDERVALLKKLWGEGKTAAEIAKELGNTTRNAVIGKAHRMKLSSRVSPIQQNRKSAKAKKPAATEKPAVTTAQMKAAPAPTPKDGIDMADLNGRTCRWPYGDPRHEDFKFCGATTSSGLPYCEAHAQKAYKTPGRKKKGVAADIADKLVANA